MNLSRAWLFLSIARVTIFFSFFIPVAAQIPFFRAGVEPSFAERNVGSKRETRWIKENEREGKRRKKRPTGGCVAVIPGGGGTQVRQADKGEGGREGGSLSVSLWPWREREEAEPGGRKSFSFFLFPPSPSSHLLFLIVFYFYFFKVETCHWLWKEKSMHARTKMAAERLIIFNATRCAARTWKIIQRENISTLLSSFFLFFLT